MVLQVLKSSRREKVKMCKFLIICCLSLIANPAIASTMFTFDSSPTSWVGQGESVSVTPEDGYLFTPMQGPPNHIKFRISSLNSPFGPDWDPSSGQPYNYWTLYLAAPFNAPLEVGTYTNTARYPFQKPEQPGLTLSGNHRGNNRNGGFFEILEISFDTNNALSSLWVDFTQYGERQESRWISGSLHYNSSATNPVPEPTTLVLFGAGIIGLFGRNLRRKSY